MLYALLAQAVYSNVEYAQHNRLESVIIFCLLIIIHLYTI